MLSEYFGIDRRIVFDHTIDGYAPFVSLNSPHGSCRIALHGAHILSYIPHGTRDDLLWLSECAIYEEGTAIRGGIPICWPWFASEGSPAHGFARNRVWEVVRSGIDENDDPHITLRLEFDKETLALWPYRFVLELDIFVSKKLTIALRAKNVDEQSFSFTEALHTYLNISDVSDIRIKGLSGCHYSNSLDGKTYLEEGNITIDAEVDRIYSDASAVCQIEDSGRKRTITVYKENSLNTVVWNPWIEKSSGMKDMADGAYRSMVCVESANTAPNYITLSPGSIHEMRINISHKNF